MIFKTGAFHRFFYRLPPVFSVVFYNFDGNLKEHSVFKYAEEMHQPGDKKAPGFLVPIGKGYPNAAEEDNKGQLGYRGTIPDGPGGEIRKSVTE